MSHSSLCMSSVASIILGGGEGRRLYPLTLTRCKPAINFGGKYRLIDVPLSLSIHANCRKIFVLTQFLSSSLHRHIFETYMVGGQGSGRIEVLTAEQRPSTKSWFQGTADAVRQNLDYLLETPVDYFLILSGDQLYNLDFKKMLQFALSSKAEAVIAALPVSSKDASRMGIMKINAQGFVTDFHEKPQEEALLKELKLTPKKEGGSALNISKNNCYLGSMGIYLFKRKTLIELLRNDQREDFGKHLIPSLICKGKTAAFIHEGYWEDIGTVRSFYEANMALTKSSPRFCLHDETSPIFTSRWDLPSAKIDGSYLSQSIISEGAVLDGVKVRRSILGPRCVIQKGTVVEDSYLMGNDYYKMAACEGLSLPSEVTIGKNCTIKKAIIDKNVLIGNDVQLINEKQLQNYDGGKIFIIDGIIIVPKGSMIPDGFIL